MDATQMINDSILESDDEENEEENENKRGRPLAKLCILKNQHIPEAELPLFLGENILGRDPNTCTLPLPAASISKQHAAICISVYRRRGRHSEVDVEALVWDLGSMNGTRKGHLKLTPNVRYALSERDRLVVADIPCQYVSCAVDIVPSQGDTISVSRNSGVKARLADASGEKGGDTRTGGKKCVNGGTEARVSLPDLEDTKKTPVRTGCLTFEQTPTQPQGTLVPESDSDSEGERGGANRRHKALVSDSDKSSPTCSTFLSPTNKIVRDSVDESPITPSSSTKNRPNRHVSFSKETDIDVGRQQLKGKKALVIVDDSEEEEERAALGGRKSDECNVSLAGEDESPVSTAAVAIPAFNMDSDTDVEGEEEGVGSAGPVTLNTDQQADQPPNTAEFHVDFHMDSDTDVDEDDDTIDNVPKSVPSSADNAKPPHVISVQPEAITMDSDTDVDDDAVVSDAALEAKPVSFQSTETADSAPSTQIKNFYLDSDTDVDEEEEKDSRTINTSSKIDETPTRLDIKSIGAESAAVTAHSLHLDSDTDDEIVPAPVISEPSAASAVTKSCTAEDTGSDVDALSDSDKDDDSCLVIPCVATALTFVPRNASEALQSDSDADTDVDEPSIPPAGVGVNPADLRVDSDTDVEDEGVDFGGAGDGQIPSLQRENTPGLLVPLLQQCSTPVQEREVEDMDTQAFLSPSSGPFRSAVASAVRPESLSSCSGSQADEDFIVAETQSFILQTGDCQGNPPEDHSKGPTRAFGPESSGDENGEQSGRQGSFQLGLSDSSHLQDQAQALAMESTQAFVSVERGLNMEETRPYAAVSNAERTSVENDSNLEATQDYGEVEEPEKEGQVDLALEATQAYISEPSDSEDKTDGDERNDTATQPLDFPVSSTLTTMETQPMFAFEEEEEESLDEENPFGLRAKAGPQNETQEREEPEEDEPQARTLSKALSIAETQPMHASDNEESDEEDLIPGPQRGKAQPLQPVDEQTQPLTSSELSLAGSQPAHICVDETQPMATSGNVESDVGGSIPHTASELSAAEGQPVDTGKDGESDEEDSIPAIRKRKAKPLPLEEESQTLTNSELSAVEGQPMNSGNDGESDDEDSMPIIRKRKAKPLQLEEESQTLTNSELSAVEGQPMNTGNDGESDDEDSMPIIRKRKAKPLQLEEESQTLTNSELSAVEAQPVATGDDGESDDEDSVPGPRKRKAKPLPIQEETQTLTNSEVSTVETDPLETNSGLQPQSGKGGQSEAGTSGITIRGKTGTKARLREEEGQTASSEPPKRQTRGKNKALQTAKGSRGKPRPDEDEEVEEAKQTRGKKSTSQPKDDEKEEETEENKRAENNNQIKEQEAERLVEEGEEERKQEERKQRREEQEKMETERKEKEEQEARNAERLRLEQERAEKETIERERKEQEEKERAERAQKEKEQLERDRKEKEEKDRLEHEKAEREERERLEKEENERIEKERKEQEEKARLETVKRELEERLERERKEQEDQARLEREAKEKENKPKTPARGRRAARRTTAATCTTELEQDPTVSINDDVPARRTRSRSNSSNSVNSEMSASSVSTQESSGRGRGRGAKRTSESPRAAAARSSNRRRTVDAGPAEQDNNDISPQGVLSRSNSNNSLNSEISSGSLNSQSRGRGGRQRGRGRRTETDSLINSLSDQNSAPKPPARGRKSRKADESSNAVPHEDEKEKADSQQASTTRGQWRANANCSEPAAADEEDSSYQEEGCANVELVPPKKNVRARGQKAPKSETVEASVAPAINDGGEAKGKGRKRDLEPNTEEESSSGFKTSKGATEAAEAKTKDKFPVQARKRGRASTSQAKKTSTEVEVTEESERVEEEVVKRRGKGRPSAVQKKKTQEQEESGSSVDQDARVESSEPQTPKSSGSRKRQAPADFSPVAKTPRSSSASPAASGRLRAASQAYKVLFTGVVDEAGERVLARLGGSMAKGVADMNCLVTDKVRRTVKFLCAVAKGVPIVTTHWLEKSGKAGSFLSPNAFVVNDLEQEKKFNFCLQESLRIASSQPLLQGYEIHVTKSVKPEPVQMKDIVACSGATFLAKMPSSHKPRTVVISCEEDWFLCGPALAASLPVVTAEFILSGILQQKLDFQTNALSAPTSNLQAAGGRGRGRKKT